MIKALELGNLRSIVEPTRIELKPITLFLGQNSSGKSTVLRTIPLFKQSLRTRSSAPVLWYGEFVDFGSIAEVKSSLTSEDRVTFGFESPLLEVSDFRNPYTYSEISLRDVSVRVRLSDVDGNTRTTGFEITVGDDLAKFEVDARGVVTSALLNDLDATKAIASERYRVVSSTLIPQFTVQRKSSQDLIFARGRVIDVGFREILARVNMALDARVSQKTISGTARKIIYSPKAEFEARLRAANSSMVSWQRQVAWMATHQRSAIEELRLYSLLTIIPAILLSFQNQAIRSFSESAYIGPSRATGERYYRHQELAVDQIDAQGRNLPTFLYSLSITQRENFSTWLEDSVGYSIQVQKSGGHLQISLKEANGDRYHNIADMGYGFSQVLPVLAQIWSWQHSARKNGLSSLLAIEQPELHLHPAYQSLLADIFMQFANSAREGESNKLIVETHSEALINRLGELIYQGKLSKEAVGIYIFERPDGRSPTKVINSSFDDSGVLSNWPVGFFSARAKT